MGDTLLDEAEAITEAKEEPERQAMMAEEAKAKEAAKQQAEMAKEAEQGGSRTAG